jgi:hypothetical protein
MTVRSVMLFPAGRAWQALVASQLLKNDGAHVGAQDMTAPSDQLLGFAPDYERRIPKWRVRATIIRRSVTRRPIAGRSMWTRRSSRINELLGEN